jgi:amino acid transporter
MGEGNWEYWSTEAGANKISYANVLGEYLGPAGGIAFAAIAVIANLSIYNAYIASGSRGFFVLAEDNLGPPVLAKISKRGTPHIAIISMAVVNAVLCQFPFAVVVVLGMFMFMVSQALILVAGVRMRKQVPIEDRPKDTYKIPLSGGTLLAMAIMPCLIMVFALYTSGVDYFFAGVLFLLTGPFMYMWWKKKYGGLAVKNPDKYPVNPKTGMGVIDFWHLSNVFLTTAAGSIAARFILPWFESDWDPLWDYDISGIVATDELYELAELAELGGCYYDYELEDYVHSGGCGPDCAAFIELEDELYPAAEALISGLHNGVLVLGLIALVLGLAFRFSYNKQKKEAI